MSGDREHEPEGARMRAWERWPGEPASSYRLFVEYVTSNSLRAAVAALAKKDGRPVPRHVSGRAWTYACQYRFKERRDLHLVRVAERERELLEKKRRVARARRVATLEKLGGLFSARVAGMEQKDIEKMDPHRLVETLLKTHIDEREELRDRPEDDASRADEHAPPLPRIEDVIKPPEERPE